VTAAPGGGTIVAGTLNSVANKTYTIEFFSSATADPSTFGEGAVSLGTISVTTDAAGNAVFSATLAAGVAGGSVITATATDTTNEPNEQFYLNLSGAVNGTITDSQGVATINNDDLPPGLSVCDVQVQQPAGNGPAVFTITLSQASGVTTQVSYATSDGTATA